MPDPGDSRAAGVAGPGRRPGRVEPSRLVHEAPDLNLPVEPGVGDGRNALVRWAVPLVEEVPS